MSFEAPADVMAVIEDNRHRTFDALSVNELCRVTVDLGGTLKGVVFLKRDVFTAGSRQEVAAEVRDAIRAARATAAATLGELIAAAQGS